MKELMASAWREAGIELSIEMGMATKGGIIFKRQMDVAIAVLNSTIECIGLMAELKGNI